MTEEEFKKELNEWDDALLDLVNKGLVETVKKENGEVGFRIKDCAEPPTC
jgi:hypothetical protein